MAGMIASLWQALPQKTNQQIRDIVLQSADKFGNPNNQLGYGIPNFAMALNNQLSSDSLILDEFIVYPNPTSDLIIMVLPAQFKTGTLFIYNTIGQIMIEQNIISTTPMISLKSLEKGLYFYKMESDNFSKSGKIIKQ
jgi:hypothetical protein